MKSEVSVAGPASSYNSSQDISNKGEVLLLLDEKYIKKKHSKPIRNLRYLLFSVCRRFFSIIFAANISVFIGLAATHQANTGKVACAVISNFLVSVLTRQEYVIDTLFSIFSAWPQFTPLIIRRISARIFHVVLIINDGRKPGETLLHACKHNAAFWLQCIITFSIVPALPPRDWRNRIIIRPDTGTAVRITHSPPKEWRTFVPENPSTKLWILHYAPDVIPYDIRKCGKPELVNFTLKVVKEFDAEAVGVIPNRHLTEKLVYGLTSRGIPAHGAIFDS